MNRSTPHSHGRRPGRAGLLAVLGATGCSADQSAATTMPRQGSTRRRAATTDRRHRVGLDPARSPTCHHAVATPSTTTPTAGRCRPVRRAARPWRVATSCGRASSRCCARTSSRRRLAEAFDGGRLEMTDVRVTATVTPTAGRAGVRRLLPGGAGLRRRLPVVRVRGARRVRRDPAGRRRRPPGDPRGGRGARARRQGSHASRPPASTTRTAPPRWRCRSTARSCSEQASPNRWERRSRPAGLRRLRRGVGRRCCSAWHDFAVEPA